MKLRFFVFLVLLLAFLASGCAARRSGGGGWFSNLTMPPLLTVVLTNNTTVPVQVFENGQPVMAKGPDGQWHDAFVPPGGVVSRGYYNFLGSREIVITVRGVCPPTPVVEVDKKAAASTGCTPGQYAGTESRRFTIYTNGQYRTDHWEIDYLRGPRGVR